MFFLPAYQHDVRKWMCKKHLSPKLLGYIKCSVPMSSDGDHLIIFSQTVVFQYSFASFSMQCRLFKFSMGIFKKNKIQRIYDSIARVFTWLSLDRKHIFIRQRKPCALVSGALVPDTNDALPWTSSKAVMIISASKEGWRNWDHYMFHIILTLQNLSSKLVIYQYLELDFGVAFPLIYIWLYFLV